LANESFAERGMAETLNCWAGLVNWRLIEQDSSTEETKNVRKEISCVSDFLQQPEPKEWKRKKLTELKT
jgi:hypothetical protein